MDGLFEKIWQSFSGKLLEILPQSPQIGVDFADVARDYMGMLNWLIPVGLIVDTLGGVLTCLAVYYGLRIILRLLHVID